MSSFSVNRLQALVKQKRINEAYNLLTGHLLTTTSSKQITRIDELLKKFNSIDDSTIFMDQTDELVVLIRLMGKTGVCIAHLEEQVLTKILDCCIKVLMHREFIDVLLPWISQIVHNAALQNEPSPKSQRLNVKTSGSQLLNLDQLSNLFECLLVLLKDPSD